MCRLSLACDLAGVRETARAAREFLARQGLIEPDLIACELALVEACNNAIVHAPAESRQVPIEINLLFEDPKLELHVIDHTRGFDWPGQMDLPPLEEEHGRGLFIIRSVMDDVLYLRGAGENRLVMRKTWPAREERDAEATKDQQSADSITSDHPSESLPDLQKKLALSEQVIGTMAKELCFRSEELAAIFRCTSELGRTNELESFAKRLLGDLMNIAAADWYVMRLLSPDESRLLVTLSSEPELEPGSVVLPPNQEPLDSSSPCSLAAHSVELQAALGRKDVLFGGSHPLAPADPLASSKGESLGLVRPIVMGDKLLGTLAVGRKADQPHFSVEQVEVIRTFSEFLAIQIVNARLHKERVDLQVTAHELEIARYIQQTLLPKNFPSLHGFGLHGFCRSARQVGGDFYDILPLREDRVLLVVADVMGKGVPAALFAATFHTLVRTMTEWTDRPAELLARMNRLLFEELSSVDMFITAQLVLADVAARKLIVASAGHCPLLLAGPDRRIRSVSPDGMPLGILRDVVFAEEVVALEEGSCALLYTDGLTEARNPHGEFFGEVRLFNWLKEKAGRNKTASQLSEEFLSELKSFQCQVPLSDDQTFLLLSSEPTVECESVISAPETRLAVSAAAHVAPLKR